MKKLKKDKDCIYIIFFLASALIFLQRFAPDGSYKPVMDDWFLYGDIYENMLTDFIIPNEKFAIRPMAGLIDIFVAAPLFKHLWLMQIFLTTLMVAGTFFLLDTFRKNDFPAGALFILLLCMLPMNMEATYWIAASIRISCALFFTGLSCWLLNDFLISEKKPFIIAYGIIGFVTVSFYEPPIIIYLFISCYLILKRRDKKYFWIFAITTAHVVYIALYYMCNGFSSELAARGHLMCTDFGTHAADVTDMMLKVFVLYNKKAFILGFNRGIHLILNNEALLLTVILIISILLGLLSGYIAGKNEKFNFKRFVICIILFVGGIGLFYLLDDLYIAIRFVYFSFIAIGLAGEELLLLTTHGVRKIINAALVAVLSFVFTVSGMGIVQQYREISETDTGIVEQILKLDTEGFVTNPDRNTYLLCAEPYYENIATVEWLESIRAACSSYADLTGCVRHVSGASNTNNITPAANGSKIKMSYYINNPDICRFFALQDDLKVTEVYLYQNGRSFDVRDNSFKLYGIIEPLENDEYIFWEKSV